MPSDGLDPPDWSGLRALGHRMLDDMFDDLAAVRDGPVWQPMPPAVRDAWAEELPRDGAAPEDVYQSYRELVAPYGVGNRHPRFLGWVHGGGTAVGMLAELLAGGLNANCGGRDHAPIACERQVVRWAATMLGFPQDASGLVVTGTSMANLVAVLVARTAALGPAVRADGVGGAGLAAYASEAAHLCVARAIDMAGIGSASLRLVPCDAAGAIDPAALAARIREDRVAGRVPFLVVGTAGSVDTGAIDDLAGLSDLCRAEGLWFHVDAAFGALAMLSPALRPLLAGIERADSVAFDFHKWMQVPYDAGCIVVRDAAAHRAAFARAADYLQRDARGLAAGEPWPVDLGPELSRGFRALKVWMTLKVYGADRLGQRGGRRLRAGPAPGRRHRCRAAAGTLRPGGAERRVLPLPRRRPGGARRGSAGGGGGGAVHHGDRRPACVAGRVRQPPHYGGGCGCGGGRGAAGRGGAGCCGLAPGIGVRPR